MNTLPPSKPDAEKLVSAIKGYVANLEETTFPKIAAIVRSHMTRERLIEELTRLGFSPTRYTSETIYSVPFNVDTYPLDHKLEVRLKDDGTVEVEYGSQYESANLPLVPFVWEVLDLVRAYQEGKSA